jgi:GAF domain-containing protein
MIAPSQGTGWPGRRFDLLTRDVNSGTELARARKELFAAALREARRRAPKSIRASFRVYDETRKNLRFVSHDGPGWTAELLETIYAIDEPSSGARVIRDKKPHYLPAIQTQPGQTQEWYRKLFDDAHALCSFPIFERGKIFGVLTLLFAEPQEFADARKRDLETVALECGQVLNHFALIEDGWLLELNDKLDKARPRTIENVCDIAASQVQRIFGVRACSVFIYDARAGVLRPAGSTLPGYQEAEKREYSLGVGLTGWTALHKTTLRIRDYHDPSELADVQRQLRFASPRLEHVGLFDDLPGGTHDSKTFLATALTVSGRLIGVVRVSAKVDDPVEFQHDDEVILQKIAVTLALIIENINLYEAQAGFIFRVEEIGVAFAKTLMLDDLLASVSEAARDYAGMDYAVMRVPTPAGRWKVNNVRGGESLRLRLQDEIDNNHPVVRQALIQEDPGPYDISQEEYKSFVGTMPPGVYKEFLMELKLILVVPIRLEAEVLGLLCLSSKTIEALDPTTINGLRIISSYTALSIKLLDLRRSHVNADHMMRAMTLCLALFFDLPHAVPKAIGRLDKLIEAAGSSNPELQAIKDELRAIKIKLSDSEQMLVERAIARNQVLDAETIIANCADEETTFWAPMKNIKITSDLPMSGSCRIFCNELQLRTILRLICQNAAKAIDDAKREGTIHFAARLVAKTVILEVKDNGIGMTKQQLDELDTVQYPPRPGHHGVSVVAAKIFMEMNRGNLDVTSKPNKGTVVSLIFPAF